jgi:ParB-like chromosome segregation protein Spo0J
MDTSPEPNLRFLHSEATLNRVKLDHFRGLSSDELRSSLALGQEGSLKVRPDGTVLDGHHRIRVLMERGVDIHKLPREIMEKDHEP